MEGTSLEICYDLSSEDKKCEMDIDNVILTRWNNFMMKGSFRFDELNTS